MSRFLICFATVFALAGCTSTSPYAIAGKEYDEAIVNAKASVKLLSDQRQKVARIGYVDDLLSSPQPSLNTIEKEFVNFACAGSGVLSIERSKLRILGNYGSSIGALTKQPDQDVVSLLASIATVDEKLKPISAGKPSTEQNDCADEVEGLLDMKAPGSVETGALGALLSFKSLVGSINDIAVIVLGQIDERKRVEALKKYVHSNSKTVSTLLREIASVDTDMDSLCNGTHGKRPYCRTYTVKPENAKADFVLPMPTKIAAQFVWQKRASLRQPYWRFQVALGALKSAKSVQEKAAALDGMLKVHRLLGEYDALRVTQAPDQLTDSLEEAQKVLVAVSEGTLPAGSGWAQFKAWADAFGSVAKGLTDAQDAVDKLKE